MVEKARRIALVGNGATTRASDNFDGEIWTTASVAKILPRVDRVFEVHKEYDAARLNGYKCPIMTDGIKADLPLSEDLRIDHLVDLFGPVFQFSFDYMMAIARLEHGRRNITTFPDSLKEAKKATTIENIEITTYGIDLSTEPEYNAFRVSFYYWVGMLRGAGVTVNISQGSAIFNRRWVYCHERDEIKELSTKLLKIADEKQEEQEQKADEGRMGIAFVNGYRKCVEDMQRMGV